MTQLRLALAVIVTCLLLWSNQARADWEMAVWGMTPAELVVASQGTYKQSKGTAIDRVSGFSVGNTGSYTRDNHTFRAVFYYKGTALSEIRLNRTGPKGPFNDNSVGCDRLLQDLRRKYGADQRGREGAQGRTKTWYARDDKNVVTYSASGADCYVSYANPIAHPIFEPVKYNYGPITCEASWDEYCRIDRTFKLPADLRYCQHDLRVLVSKRADLPAIQPREDGLYVYIMIRGNHLPVYQKSAKISISVTVVGISKLADQQERNLRNCRSIAPRSGWDVVCKESRIPTGWIQTSTLSRGSCPPNRQGRREAWQIERYDTLPVGSTIDVCMVAKVPSGWKVVRLLRSGQCNPWGPITDRDARRIERTS